MPIDLNALPAFGKCARDEAWARIRRQQATVNASRWRIAVAFACLAGLSLLLAMDAAELLVARSQPRLWLLPSGGEQLMAAMPGLVGPVLLLLPIGFLVQVARNLVKISLSDEPILFVDYTGIALLTADGWQIFLWDEIAKMTRWPGFVTMRRTRRGFGGVGLDGAVSSMRVTIPTLFLVGGEESFIDALVDVRPELARTVFGENVTGGG